MKVIKRVWITLALAIFCGLGFIFYILTDENKDFEIEEIENFISKAFPLKEPEYLYGFSLDSFYVEQYQVKKNDVMGNILARFSISNPNIIKLTELSKKEGFDIRKIRLGDTYTSFFDEIFRDSLKILVYEINPIDYVIFDFRDSVSVTKVQKEVITKQNTFFGTINSSLYATLQNANINLDLAIKLSEIYAWSIDFYKIQKGDNFKVVYEERFVDDKSIGISLISACVFNHHGSDFYAVRFMQDSIWDYYDDEGNSLRKAFLKAPLKFSRISSGYSNNRFHPVQKRWKAHLGTDYAAPRGTPILSTGDGIVTEARFTSNNGYYVKIKHNNTYSTQYLHMSKFAKGIKAGKRVRQGDVIGYVGSTGLATGPHVCYRFWKNGHQVDPYKQKIPASKPVKPDNMPSYKTLFEEKKTELNAI